MRISTFFLGLVTGSVAAAVTVIYSTPQSGSELRSSVKSASTDMKGKFGEVKVKIAELKESITHMTKEAKENVPIAVEGIKDSIQHWQQSTEPIKERMEKEIAAIQTALEKLEKSIEVR
ncbi:YtxH domain-containing protein [Sporosarcina limicola]|uniref:Gas vesicle protein n=1 Tax=Sporosarcina limicola TaxID=34101 RepID=A0A927MNX6_9BACL|nr:YtxH domain-containing protein [Sporosarcina limicola]MBE1554904.1 gas vesicle protein [Sporosarcina limicola]